VSAHATDIAIIGGGIVGASCAYFLAERGESVLLLESGRVGRESSGVNAGGVRQQGRALPEIPLALSVVNISPHPRRSPRPWGLGEPDVIAHYQTVAPAGAQAQAPAGAQAQRTLATWQADRTSPAVSRMLAGRTHCRRQAANGQRQMDRPDQHH
jgi:glycine/D-amino acid oxidase-like deaminating enzyme